LAVAAWPGVLRKSAAILSPPVPTAALRIDEETDRVSVLGDIVIWLSLAAPPAPVVRRVRTLVEQVTAQTGRQVTLFVVCTEQTGIPDAASRAESVAFLREQAPSLAAVAVCFEGEGFRVSALRSVMSGITIAVRRPYRVKLFATRKEAAAWATQSPALREALLAAVAELESPDSEASSR
jgi:hypothetical protein